MFRHGTFCKYSAGTISDGVNPRWPQHGSQTNKWRCGILAAANGSGIKLSVILHFHATSTLATAQRVLMLRELVLVFRPFCSLAEVDHGFLVRLLISLVLFGAHRPRLGARYRGSSEASRCCNMPCISRCPPLLVSPSRRHASKRIHP